MIATIENMREHYAPGVFAYSPLTGESYSANPGDYFWLPEDTPLTDFLGEPMDLVTSRRELVPVGAR